jgi:hypothetical protein
MRFPKFALLGLATLGVASSALANGRNPGSLLLFPEFDNRYSHLTMLTVTNTNTGENLNGSDGTIRVEFVYIGRYGQNDSVLPCLETNRTHELTANDTLSLLTSFHNPNHAQGYVYVFAKDEQGRATPFNFLIGNLLTLESIDQLEYSLNPVAFKGFGDEDGTDADNDGVRDLDGVEYEPVPDEVYIPRFIGSTAYGNPEGGATLYDSELILIALSGGIRFQTVANFWVYNDNEEAFSAQYQFQCWDRVKLRNINGIFTQDFLANSTNHDDNEIVGANTVETGWIQVYGHLAWSTAEAIDDPAVYAVLVERIAGYGAADLPFESVATQTNGDLLPTGIFGDPNPGTNDDDQ